MTTTGQMEPIDVAEAWREFGERLRAYAARRVPQSEADDLVQSVMLKLLERRETVSAGSVRAWLFTVTRNAVVEHYRGSRNTIDLDAFGDVPATDAKDARERTVDDLASCLEPMLRSLGSSDAELLRRIDLDGESQTQLAASLAVPLSTLKSRIQRARTKLRTAFDTCCAIELSRDGVPIDMEKGPGCAGKPSCAD
jgi:RNA polymerase sigma-70 factor (ECF subfamily)